MDSAAKKHTPKNGAKKTKGSAERSAKAVDSTQPSKKGGHTSASKKSAPSTQMTLDDLIEKKVVVTAADKTASLFGTLLFMTRRSIHPKIHAL